MCMFTAVAVILGIGVLELTKSYLIEVTKTCCLFLKESLKDSQLESRQQEYTTLHTVQTL